jgi:hypothetical protein
MAMEKTLETLRLEANSDAVPVGEFSKGFD